MTPVRPLLAGAIMMSFAYAGMFFLRYWRRSGDRFFLLFSAAFFCLALERLAVQAGPFEAADPSLYLIRLLAYCFILRAVWDKNRSGTAGQ
jgi:hypothetical protein